jgi:hypothetical protein
MKTSVRAAVEVMFQRRASVSYSGSTVDKIAPPQDGYFFFRGEMLPFLPHTFAPLSQRMNAVLHFQLRQDIVALNTFNSFVARTTHDLGSTL